MIFNSISFVIFFSIFFILYWCVFNRNFKLQNALLLVASYVFYAWVDWRFLPFLIGVSALNFILGIGIYKTSRPHLKYLLLFIGLLQGIGGLFYFKYYNFFIGSFNDAFSLMNVNVNLQFIKILVPLGISFFTFRTISYLIDIYRGKTEPTTSPVIFFTYVAFFPSLLSGPIDKSAMFIPQLEKPRVFNEEGASDGLRQILWGLFKKVVVADNCATITNGIFSNYESLPASALLIGGVLYAIQMYTDFSGYSDMAIGFARLIGFRITKNFDFPFFAQNIAQFWRKWHISLTAWLTEYVFIPLSIKFRDYGKTGLFLAILINFITVGLWHGANWTYVFFGILHACYFIPLIINGTVNKTRKVAKGRLFPTVKEALNMLGTFTLAMLALITFRSDTIVDALQYYAGMFSLTIFSAPGLGMDGLTSFIILSSIGIMFIIEWLGREKDHALSNIQIIWPAPVRWSLYYSLALAIFVFAGGNQQFIYFQF